MSDWTDLTGRLRVQQGDTPEGLHQLLHHTIQAFAYHSRRFHDRTGDHAFAYREPQVHSVLLPALRDVAPAVFREHPKARDRSTGWVDYWLEHDSKEHWVEVKHGFEHTRRTSFRVDEQKKWKHLLKQLDEDRAQAEDKDEVWGIHIIVHYNLGDEPEATTPDACWARHQAFLSDLALHGSPARWSAVWLVPEDMQLADWDGRTEQYPALSFFVARRPSD